MIFLDKMHIFHRKCFERILFDSYFQNKKIKMNSQYVRMTFPLNKNIQVLAPVHQSLLDRAQVCSPSQLLVTNSNSCIVIPPSGNTLELNVVSCFSMSLLDRNEQALPEECSSLKIKPVNHEPSPVLNPFGSMPPVNNSIQYGSMPNTSICKIFKRRSMRKPTFFSNSRNMGVNRF